MLGRPSAQVSLVLTSDETLRILNRDYLETDHPTDVLSFPLADPSELRDPSRAVFLGEIYISLETARRQARARGRPYHVEVAHLALHGLLHLLGHDHPTPAARRRMRGVEGRLLRELRRTIASARMAEDRRGRGRKADAMMRRNRASASDRSP